MSVYHTHKVVRNPGVCVCTEQLELLKVPLNGSGRIRSPRESDGDMETIVLHWQLEINRAFPGTKLVFICINYGHGLFYKVILPIAAQSSHPPS